MLPLTPAPTIHGKAELKANQSNPALIIYGSTSYAGKGFYLLPHPAEQIQLEALQTLRHDTYNINNLSKKPKISIKSNKKLKINKKNFPTTFDNGCKLVIARVTEIEEIKIYLTIYI